MKTHMKTIIGWAIGLLSITAAIGSVAKGAKVPTCMFDMSTGACSTGCTATPVDAPNYVCANTGNGCCNGLCQLFTCQGTICTPTGYRTWTGYGNWHAGTCSANWTTGDSCGEGIGIPNVYCP